MPRRQCAAGLGHILNFHHGRHRAEATRSRTTYTWPKSGRDRELEAPVPKRPRREAITPHPRRDRGAPELGALAPKRLRKRERDLLPVDLHLDRGPGRVEERPRVGRPDADAERDAAAALLPLRDHGLTSTISLWGVRVERTRTMALALVPPCGTPWRSPRLPSSPAVEPAAAIPARRAGTRKVCAASA